MSRGFHALDSFIKARLGAAVASLGLVLDIGVDGAATGLRLGADALLDRVALLVDLEVLAEGGHGLVLVILVDGILGQQTLLDQPLHFGEFFLGLGVGTLEHCQSPEFCTNLCGDGLGQFRQQLAAQIVGSILTAFGLDLVTVYQRLAPRRKRSRTNLDNAAGNRMIIGFRAKDSFFSLDQCGHKNSLWMRPLAANEATPAMYH